MSADPRGAESAAESRRWYLEMSGRRAGPFAWAVLVELAQAGALGADARMWHGGLATWSRAADFPDLAPLIREPAASTRTAAAVASSEPAAGAGRPPLRPILLAAATAWISLTLTFFYERMELWPGVLDGVLAERLNATVPLALLVMAACVLPGLWRATRPDELGRNGLLRGGIRTVAGICALALPIGIVSSLLNARPLLLIAIGEDPLPPAQIQLLPGGREVEIRGMLEAGVAARLRRVLDANPQVRFVHLNSPGGWVTEGDRLARLIHARHLGTYTSTGCSSACVLAFAAGAPRVLNPEARLGLHSTAGRDADPIVSTLGNELYHKVLLRYGVSRALVAWSTSTPSNGLWMPEPQQLLAGHLVDRISAEGFSPSGDSLASLAPQAAHFEARYPFLTGLLRADPSRLARLDRAVRLGLLRGAPADELNAYVADAAGQIERERLTAVADSSALRFAMSLRSAARPFQSSDPKECGAILGAPSATSSVRSAPALAAISPALDDLLDAPATPRADTAAADLTVLRQVQAAVGPPDASSRLDCDRLLLMYDIALRWSPERGAAFVRALQGH